MKPDSGEPMAIRCKALTMPRGDSATPMRQPLVGSLRLAFYRVGAGATQAPLEPRKASGRR
jgi:hypothetical protein